MQRFLKIGICFSLEIIRIVFFSEVSPSLPPSLRFAFCVRSHAGPLTCGVGIFCTFGRSSF